MTQSELDFTATTDSGAAQPTAQAPTVERPNCPLCEQPAQWQPRSGKWARYCAGNQCYNPVRICKRCRQPYDADTGGTRYCSPQCRDQYHGKKPQRRVTGDCSHCGQPRTGFNAWDLCQTCYDQIKGVATRLRNHHVPIPLVTRLLTDPTCQNAHCDINIVEPVYDKNMGRTTYRMHVDHDHTHCPGVYSCGICVRGLLCENCNRALGMLQENPARIQGLANYLTH